ncbi:MAG: GNAT family N-acetyltransferase [Pseudomonadota bacterium]
MKPAEPIAIRPVTDDPAEVCRLILRALPEWFADEQSVRDYSANTTDLHTIGAFSGERCVGLVSLRNHFDLNVEIDVMAVLPDYHGHGVGRGLVSAALRHSSKLFATYLTVKTVAETRDSTHYEMTRKFYRRTGFKDFETLEDHWGEGLDALLLIQSVQGAITPAKDQTC